MRNIQSFVNLLSVDSDASSLLHLRQGRVMVPHIDPANTLLYDGSSTILYFYNENLLRCKNVSNLNNVLTIYNEPIVFSR